MKTTTIKYKYIYTFIFVYIYISFFSGAVSRLAAYVGLDGCCNVISLSSRSVAREGRARKY